MATVPALLNPSFLSPKPPERRTVISLPNPFLTLPLRPPPRRSFCRLQQRVLATRPIASSVKEHLGRLRKTWSDVMSLNHWVVRDYDRLVKSVNVLEPEIKRLSDGQLTAKTEEFRG
ncbi:protein translocase subunit SECA2, chloroplastic-like [Carya illinoinensis]|uniref:protein translocase subunit SECA2, chloroplastic-like n=1 Tax=Carya illinoinensis TaxID=32201 RepID=UPI001C719419|nr:protein translocase subunit SECA2, chloroplastic-like [Carya illinoinensis]